MVTVNWIINTHKILVAPVVLALMWYFHNWSAAAFLYLGLHGTYALLWLIKQAVFPDKRWAQPIPLWIGVFAPFLPLMAYLVGAYLLISQHTLVPNWVFAAGPFLVILGVFLHYVGDAQKFFTLQVRDGLIVDGLFRRTRNPNYLGEIMTNMGCVLVSWHWQAALVLTGWFLYYVHGMRQKDKTLSRYPEFAAYKRRTGMLLPALNSTVASALRTRVDYDTSLWNKTTSSANQIRVLDSRYRASRKEHVNDQQQNRKPCFQIPNKENQKCSQRECMATTNRLFLKKSRPPRSVPKKFSSSSRLVGYVGQTFS